MSVYFYIKFYFMVVITLLSKNVFAVSVLYVHACVYMCIIALLRALESRTAYADLCSCYWYIFTAS